MSAVDQIERLVAGLREALGHKLLGAYLHGSSVLGGLRPDSDIDVITVLRRPTTVEERRRLVELLLDLSGGGNTRRPIEFDIVVESEIRPWRYPPRFDFHYDEGLRERFEGGELEPWTTTINADLASVITMVLLSDTAVTGPPPSDVFDPVPRADYLDAIMEDTGTVDEFLPRYTRNVVLTLARIWSAVATDRVYSKEDAANWALPLLPDDHRRVLELARDAYRGEIRDSWEGRLPEARAYADFVISEIDRARDTPSA
jgi:predicted nucleotidyltransferase